VKVQNFRKSTNKRGYVYLLTPEGVAAKADRAVLRTLPIKILV
jgi:hypothetical protein